MKVENLFATPSFQDVFTPFAQLTFLQFVLGLFFLFFIEFSFFVPTLARLQPYAPFVLHVILTITFTIIAFFVAEYYSTPTLLFIALLYIFVFYRIFALFVYDTQKSQMVVSSLFFSQNATILAPLAIDYIEQQQHQSSHPDPQFSQQTYISLGTVSNTPPKIPILMVIAHPDDESMFFTPLLHLLAEHNQSVKKRYGLTPPPVLKSKSASTTMSGADKSTDINSSSKAQAQNKTSSSTPSPQETFLNPEDLPLPRFQGVTPALYDIHILCLTSGDAAGLGKIRQVELINTCVEAHQIPLENITVIDEPRLLPDSMTENWTSSSVQRFISNYVVEKGLVDIDLTPQVAIEDHSEHGMGRKVPSVHHINFHDLIILTFDPDGVSGHMNHKACYRGAIDYVSNYNSKLMLSEGNLQNQLDSIKNFETELGVPDTTDQLNKNNSNSSQDGTNVQQKQGTKRDDFDTQFTSDDETDYDDDEQCESNQMLSHRHRNKNQNQNGLHANKKKQTIKAVEQMTRLQKPISHRYISVYGVETVPIWAKYLGPYSATLLITSQYATDAPTKNVAQKQQEKECKLVIPNLSSYQSWLSMAMHHSQWVWFRKLFVLFSTYTYITPLILIQASPLHPSLHHVARSIRDLVMDQPQPH